MEREEEFSSPVFEIVASAFGRALGELVILCGEERDLRRAFPYAAEVAREAIHACREAEDKSHGRG